MRAVILAGALLLAACSTGDRGALCQRDCESTFHRCTRAAPDVRVCEALRTDCEAQCART